MATQMETPNRFELAARERKAQAIARWIWSQTKREDRTDMRIAEGMAVADQSIRDYVARQADVAPPSDATWARACALVHDRILDERRWLGIEMLDDHRAVS